MLETLLIIAALTALFICAGALLIYLNTANNDDTRTEALDTLNAALPQLQCGLCGYPGCKPYAQALLAGEATVNLCPPGGDTVAQRLARILGVEQIGRVDTFAPHQRAMIDEDLCIGCFRCVQACPVDAIIGAPKFTHTVVQDDCTGCTLCLPVCPVNCIAMLQKGNSHNTAY